MPEDEAKITPITGLDEFANPPKPEASPELLEMVDRSVSSALDLEILGKQHAEKVALLRQLLIDNSLNEQELSKLGVGLDPVSVMNQRLLFFIEYMTGRGADRLDYEISYQRHAQRMIDATVAEARRRRTAQTLLQGVQGAINNGHIQR